MPLKHETVDITATVSIGVVFKKQRRRLRETAMRCARNAGQPGES